MDAATKRKRKELFKYASETFTKTATAMQAKDAAPDRYRVLGRKFSGLGRNLRRIDRSAQDRVTKMIGDGAKSVAEVLPQLHVKCGKRERVKQAEQLASGLDKIGDGFRMGAQSLRLLEIRPTRSRTGARKAQLNDRIRAVHDQTTALAHEYHVTAVAVREAAGLEQPAERQTFAVPALDESGCASCGFADPVIGPPLPDRVLGHSKSKGRSRLLVDQTRLLILAGQLDETSLLTLNLIAAQAELFSVVIIVVAFACSDECSPLGVVRVSLYISGYRNTPRGIFPSIGFRWVQCCPCTCAFFFTQQRRVTTLTFNQVVVLDPQRTFADATRVAAARGTQLASGFNSALTQNQQFQSPSDIVPALAPPSCNC